MRILIAEKMEKVRSALRLLIEQEPNCLVVGEESSVSSLYQDLYSLEPDLLVLEWDLPGLEGKDRIEPIRKLNPELKVVVICSQGLVGEIQGADSIISTGDPPERVLSVLRTFNGGRA